MEKEALNMSDLFATQLAKFADVIIKIGLNIQPEQRLVIDARLESVPVVWALTRSAYASGARYVVVMWRDHELERIRIQHAPAEFMSEYSTWHFKGQADYLDNGDALLNVFVPATDNFNGLDTDKVRAFYRTQSSEYDQVRTRVFRNLAPRCTVGGVGSQWAQQVFPDVTPDEAVNKLWQAIFFACRVHEPDPVAAWQAHIVDLRRRYEYLNAKQYDSLHYTAPGTDLTVGLAKNHVWVGGSGVSQNGIEFVQNMPTEEIYTMPHRDRVDGVVTATKPMLYGSSLVDNFSLRFENGVVVQAEAKAGQDALNNLLETDAASRCLGEVALVPHSSPISQSGVLFYNTLFDENASNHLALGNAYRFTLRDGESMSDEEFAAAGGNSSQSHSDFMIGSEEMNVDGILADGTREPVMRSGEWAFDV